MAMHILTISGLADDEKPGYRQVSLESRSTICLVGLQPVVDVSQAMLDLAGAKAARAGLSNISFHHAGFLSYKHTEPPVDAVVTTLALHHLPNFWMGMALKRVHGMLKRGGRLYIHDVIL